MGVIYITVLQSMTNSKRSPQLSKQLGQHTVQHVPGRQALPPRWRPGEARICAATSPEM